MLMLTKRFSVIVAVLGASLACFALGAAAQDLTLDYQLTVGGRAASVEKTVVTHTDGQVTYNSAVDMSYPQPLKMTSVLVLDEASRRPISYQLEGRIGGGTQRLDLSFNGDVVTYRAEHPGGSQTGSLKLHAGFVVWENNIWGLLTCALERMDWEKQKQGMLYVLIPTTMSEVVLRFSDRGPDTVSLSGVQRACRRLTLIFGDTLGLDVWVDPATHSPFRVVVPSQQVEVLRMDPASQPPASPGEDPQQPSNAGK